VSVEVNNILKDIHQVSYDALVNKGIDKDISQSACDAIIEAIIKRTGGTAVYIPIEGGNKRKRRNDNIASKFTGANQKQLAIKYNVSENCIYAILKNHTNQK
jgi:Mor family transcriptional regulator